ncbi:MAG: hypothetical protein FJ125_06385 [Deltaproteobacteria bacterium]|nr:hypothetical protein [Deltaproteobacteria bacterium]
MSDDALLREQPCNGEVSGAVASVAPARARGHEDEHQDEPPAEPRPALPAAPVPAPRPAPEPAPPPRPDAPRRREQASPRLRAGFPWPPPLLAAFAILALLLFALQLRWAEQVPDEQDWAAASAVLRTGWEEGDLLRIEPWWASQGLSQLRGLPVDRVRRPERPRLARYRRLWVIAAHGHACTDGALAEAELQVRQELHRLTLCRFALPWRGRPLYDLRERLQDARVRRESGKKVEECSLWAKGSWYCGKLHAWQFVGPVTKDVDDNPREAIWAHPPAKDTRLVIEYPVVPLGQTLELEAGLTLRSIISGEGSAVHFLVRVAGEKVLDTTLAPRQKGWFTWSIDTAHLAGRSERVSVVIWAKDHQVRQLLFAGRSWES